MKRVGSRRYLISDTAPALKTVCEEGTQKEQDYCSFSSFTIVCVETKEKEKTDTWKLCDLNHTMYCWCFKALPWEMNAEGVTTRCANGSGAGKEIKSNPTLLRSNDSNRQTCGGRGEIHATSLTCRTSKGQGFITVPYQMDIYKKLLTWRSAMRIKTIQMLSNVTTPASNTTRVSVMLSIMIVSLMRFTSLAHWVGLLIQPGERYLRRTEQEYWDQMHPRSWCFSVG